MKHRRPKVEGSITVLPNGHYKMTISIGVDVTWKQRRKSVTAATKTKLMCKAAQLRLSAGMAVKESPMGETKKRPVGQLKVDRVLIPTDAQMKKILEEAEAWELSFFAI